MTATPTVESKLESAIKLFAADALTLGQAAELAGITQGALMKELGRRKIPMHYGEEDFAEDLRTIEKLFGR